MKRLLLLTPFLVFTVSTLWLQEGSSTADGMAITAMASFVLSLLAVPVISRNSLISGYLATGFHLIRIGITVHPG